MMRSRSWWTAASHTSRISSGRQTGTARAGWRGSRRRRQALRDVWDAQVEGRAAAAEALATLNVLLDGGPRVELRPGPIGIEVAHRHSEDDPTGEALALLAAPLVEVLASGATDRLRICANDGCRWVFEDTSRAGRRRWCDMTTCGNRAKARRFRSKARSDHAEEALPPSGEGR